MAARHIDISAIVAMAQNRVIGRDNQLPWHLPEDLKNFKKITMGKPLIMGRKTFESIGRPLPGRANIVLSRAGFTAEGIILATTMEEALTTAKEIAEKEEQDEIMIIGGAQIFRDSLSLITRLYLTEIEEDIDGDVYFPPLDKTNWTETTTTHHPATDSTPAWCFKILEHKKPK